LFDKNSNHIITSDLTDEYLSKIRSGEYHTINSLFELHSTLGGIFFVESHDGEFIPSEFNNECIARYMNLVGDARRKHLTDMSGLKNIRIEDVVT
jgi:chemotaxis methyl-accepting protein methylase